MSNGRILLNPKETMAPREPYKTQSNNNVKEKGYPYIFPSFRASRSFPVLTKSNLHFIFLPIPFKYSYLFYLISLLGFVIILT
jgi:hypothetical protein